MMNVGLLFEVLIKSHFYRPLLNRTTLTQCFAGDATCAVSADAAFATTHRPIVWDQYSTSSGFFCVHQLEEVDAFVCDTNNTFIDGNDPHVMSMLAFTSSTLLQLFVMILITRSRRSLLLASGYWITTRLGLRTSTRSGPTPMSLLAIVFVEVYYAVILSSASPPQVRRPAA
jgi:hypothetical protein